MSTVTYSRFPAAVASPRRSERRAAVIVKDGHARVAIATPAGPKVVEEFEVASVSSAARVTTLVEPDGTEWTVSKGDGCGCASPLRTWYNRQLGTPRRSSR